MAIGATTPLPPIKRRKVGPTRERHTIKVLSDLEKLLTDALANNTALNPLADLLHIATSINDAEVALKAIFSLYRSFVQVINKGILTVDENDDENRKTVRAWVNSKLDNYTSLLAGLLKDDEKTLRTASLKILFSLLRRLSTSLANAREHSKVPSAVALQFDVSFFKKIVEALLICEPSPRSSRHEPPSTDRLLELDVRDLFVELWLDAYTDIRWFFLREATDLMSRANLVEEYPYIPANVLFILERLNKMTSSPSASMQFWIEGLALKLGESRARDLDDTDDESNEAVEQVLEDDWRDFFDEPKPIAKGRKAPGKSRRIYAMSVYEQLHSVPAHRAVFTKCWLTLLPLLSAGSAVGNDNNGKKPDRLVLVTRTLNILHRSVMPHLTRPVLIMDWIAGCVEYGGSVGLLALNALFLLMKDYNLDYPHFYSHLYTFLNRDVMHLKHRSRFFRLTEVFLSSSHLPATLLASFVKRLSRLSLSAPPAAIIMIIPFTYNILKRHPALMVMIHRSDIADGTEDPFDPHEENPTLTCALRSSLWELYSHKCHYHSSVSMMSKIFEEAFTKPNYAMEDFLDHTYGTLFETEVNRKVKKDPPTLEPEMARQMEIGVKNSVLSEIASRSDGISSMWIFD